MTVPGTEIDRIEDGNIVEGRQITDTFGMPQRISVVEPLAE